MFTSVHQHPELWQHGTLHCLTFKNWPWIPMFCVRQTYCTPNPSLKRLTRKPKWDHVSVWLSLYNRLQVEFGRGIGSGKKKIKHLILGMFNAAFFSDKQFEALHWQLDRLIYSFKKRTRWDIHLGVISLQVRRRQWHPTPVLLPGKSHGWRSLVGCRPWGRWGSDTTEWLHFHFSLSCFGEGNGNPL